MTQQIANVVEVSSLDLVPSVFRKPAKPTRAKAVVVRTDAVDPVRQAQRELVQLYGEEIRKRAGR